MNIYNVTDIIYLNRFLIGLLLLAVLGSELDASRYFNLWKCTNRFVSGIFDHKIIKYFSFLDLLSTRSCPTSSMSSGLWM